MINPRVKAETELLQRGKTPAESSIAKQPLRRFAAQSVARVPCCRVTNAAEALSTRGQMRLEHRRDRVAQKEISMSNDSGRNARFDHWIIGNSRRYAFEKLDLAHR